MESLILKTIKENKEKWEEYFANTYPDIVIKRDGNFAIFNYGIGADFNSPIVQEARGIIIDVMNEEVACWAFRKFGKYYESYADDIDWSTAKVHEKLDGNIIKLWFNKYTNGWQFSTNSTIDAKKATVPEPYNHLSFYDLIQKALEENTKIDFDKLDKDCTYIFELTGPENQVVVKYSDHRLWAIGARNNKTGEEFEPDIGVSRPCLYDITSLDNCVSYLNKMCEEDSGNVNLEGFVVVDANWNRVKIKSPIYLVMHGLTGCDKHTKEYLVKSLYKNILDVANLCNNFPKLVHIIKWYDYQVAQFVYEVVSLIDIAKKMVVVYDNNMSTIGKLLSKEKYSQFAFKAIKTGKTFEEIVEEMGIEKIAKLIPDYPKTDRSYLFQYKE